MKRETLIWTLLFVGGGSVLLFQATATRRGVGMQYVVPVQLVGEWDAQSQKVVPVEKGQASESGAVFKSLRYKSALRTEDNAVWSPARTVGIWIAALLTLAIFSYVYRDNFCYKLAESIIVGVSAGYWIVLNFWQVLVAKVLVNVAPDVARYAFLPDTPESAKPDYVYLIPLILGCLIFCRLVPKIAWLGRWPLAFVVGTTAGLKLILFLNADFAQQIRNTILPLAVYATTETNVTLDWKKSIQHVLIVVSVLSAVTYFYFSVEHKGIIGRISRMGVWVLMISFGAAFALTVMGRITLLAMRFRFLFDDWLGLVQ
jgi:hypothetical protein